MTSGETETKLCGACSNELPKDAFSKKQWQQKQQRRCKSCVDSNRDIDTSTSAAAAAAAASVKSSAQTSNSSNANASNANANANANANKKKVRKNKPAFAGNQEALHKPTTTTSGDFVTTKLASDICAWCGKAEEIEKLQKCAGCENILYCSRTCQKSAHPEHKLVCGQMKQDRKDSKKERKAAKNKHGQYGARNMSEASGVGTFGFNYLPTTKNEAGISILMFNGELRNGEEPGQHFATDAARKGMEKMLGPQKFKIFCQHMKASSLKDRGTFKRQEIFTDIHELYPIDQFLLSCGPMGDLDLAKSSLPYVLHQVSISGLMPDGSIPNIGDIKVRGYSLNALEWAARRGNYAIAEWLATDSRTKVMLTRSDSAPVAWACYTNKIELAKMLVKHGADSHATTEVVFGYKPATHLAGENGQLLALKYLVEECGHDIHELDSSHQDIRASLRVNNKVWAEVAGCVAVDEYAKSKGVEGEINRRNMKTKVSRGINQQAVE